MENVNNNESVAIPDLDNDYHGHPNYTRVLVTLLVLLGVSLAVGYFISSTLGIVLIFATAIWKAVLVVMNFMHLKYEPVLIFIAVCAVLFCLLAFFWGVFPDVPMVTREIAK